MGVSPIRRRRISQGGGWAKGRDRSSSRPRPVPIAVSIFLEQFWGAVKRYWNFIRLAVRNYVWPALVWLLVLTSALFTLGVCLRLCEILAEPVAGMAGEIACSIAPKAVPGWLSAVPGPFHGITPCAIPPQSAAEAILDGPTAATSLMASPWPVSEASKVIRSHYENHQWVLRAEAAAREIRAKLQVERGFAEAYAKYGKVYPGREGGVLSPRAVQIAKIIGEWSDRHEKSWRLIRESIWDDLSFRRMLRSQVGRLLREIKKYEAEGLEESKWSSLLDEWVPGVFSERHLGREVVRRFDNLARDRALEARRISGMTSEILRALSLERAVLHDLKVALPVNLEELNVEYDLVPLQAYLQYEFEGWMQGALTLAVRFQKEKQRLGKQFEHISAALRPAYWNRNTRVELKKAIKGNVEELKTYLSVFLEYLEAEGKEAHDGIYKAGKSTN